VDFRLIVMGWIGVSCHQLGDGRTIKMTLDRDPCGENSLGSSGFVVVDDVETCEDVASESLVVSGTQNLTLETTSFFFV
jgi:hypothetical protein